MSQPPIPEQHLQFTITHGASESGPRVGRLQHRSRDAIDTPHFLGNTSRGIIPHIAPDVYRKYMGVGGVYVALEDFVEGSHRKAPPISKLSSSSSSSSSSTTSPSPSHIPSFRTFLTTPPTTLLVLSPRRASPVPSPNANTVSALAVFTSSGFQTLSCASFTSFAQTLRPDIVVAPGDIPFGTPAPSQKKREKMVERTAAWVGDMVGARTGDEEEEDGEEEEARFSVFAPVLPIPVEQQTWYTERLVEELLPGIAGLAVYEAEGVVDLPAPLRALPRMSLDGPRSPARILYEIGLGLDLFVVPFVGEATDAGIALHFGFPGSARMEKTERVPLGVDMWQAAHALDVAPLMEGCDCYACTRHHRAYVQHLLVAKEMLAWVLLQVHNHRVMDVFFGIVRASIARGSFEQDRQRFEETYEAELPEQTGKGPRVRGYQFKAEGPAEPKKNELAYRMLDDKRDKLSEASSPTPGTEASDLESIGFAEVTKTL